MRTDDCATKRILLMKYRIFGKTGEKVSVLGYGNMRLPVQNHDYGHITAELLLAEISKQAAQASLLSARY